MSDLAKGTVVEGLTGSYLIEQRHGEGGFGVTYAARDRVRGDRLIVKVLRFDRMRDWKSLELFEREGRVLARLSHPSIPRYRDFFATDGARAFGVGELTSYQGEGRVSLVLVQELVEGPTLAARVAQGPLPCDEVEMMLVLLLEVLEYLHGLAPPVVHRDINPKNIVLSREGRPFLVDFGAIQDTLRFGGEVGSTSVGTMGFMPLEQVRGESRAISDLYGLGMTMLVALSGRQPAEMPIDDDTGKVRVDEVASSAPPHVRAVLSAMVEPAPGRRIGSASEALARLRAPVFAAPAPRRSGGPAVVFALAGVLLVGSLGVAGLVFVRTAPTRKLPVITESPSMPVTPATPATPPRAAEPVRPPTAPTATPSSPPIEVVFPAVVQQSNDASVGAGARCSIKATLFAADKGAGVSALSVQCGSKTLYDSRHQLNGMSSSSTGAVETPVAGKAGVFEYDVAYSDVGPRSGERAQVTLDSRAGQAVAFRETVPVYRVVMRVDRPQPREGAPLLAANTQPFSRVVTRSGKVKKVDGKAPVKVGAPCTLVVSPATAGHLTCRATLTCGGAKLYGAHTTSGFAPCVVEGDAPQSFEDPGTSEPGGDPEAHVDLRAGTARIHDERPPGPFTVEVELAP